MSLDAWLSEWGVTLGVGALMVFMVFIVWDLAKRNNAGRYGTFILYIALAMGLLGFLIKGASGRESIPRARYEPMCVSYRDRVLGEAGGA